MRHRDRPGGQFISRGLHRACQQGCFPHTAAGSILEAQALELWAWRPELGRGLFRSAGWQCGRSATQGIGPPV